MPSKMDPPHPAGLAHVREGALQQFSPTAQEPTAPRAANPPPVAIHRIAGLRPALPAPTAPVRLRDVAAQAQRLQVGHCPVAVVALVAHHFCNVGAVRLNRLDVLGRHDQRLDHRRRVARVGRLHRDADDRATLQVHGVLGLVGQVRPAVLHLRDPRMRVMGMGPVGVRRLLLALCGTYRSVPAQHESVSRCPTLRPAASGTPCSPRPCRGERCCARQRSPPASSRRSPPSFRGPDPRRRAAATPR